ncbi:MAG: hypothetical protein ABEJ42_05605 [Halobacteriaceae archaeon]
MGGVEGADGTGRPGAGDDTPTDDLIADLAAAGETLDAAAAAVADRGAAETDRLADAHDRVAGILDRFEERATDWDDFEGYAEFRTELGRAVADLSDDLPERAVDALEAADDHLVTGGVAETLDASDFERAREELEPLAAAAADRDALAAARERYATARSTLVTRRDALDDRADELERLQRLGEADLDAPVERLREPVAAYDDGVTDAFADHRQSAPLTTLLDLLATAAERPYVDYDSPPERLRDYAADAPVGDEPLPTVLEYLSFSRSKLAHYVEDPDRFRTAVATNQTYLERLDADPLTVGWPPPPADRLRYAARERIPVVGRFADDEVVAHLREVRELAAGEGPVDYGRLRESAVARSELEEAERERVQSGAVADELSRVRAERKAVEAALAEHPPVDERVDEAAPDR